MQTKSSFAAMPAIAYHGAMDHIAIDVRDNLRDAEFTFDAIDDKKLVSDVIKNVIRVQ